MKKFADMPTHTLYEYITEFKDDTIFAVTELIRRKESIAEIHAATMITELFLEAIARICK
ncbi:hypothetical protein DK853_54815, partial [Klebsiella oxytoca]